MIAIVPAPRLLKLAGILGVPALTALGLAPQFAIFILPLLVGGAAFALWDAQKGRAIISTLKVAIAGRVSLFMGRPGEFEIRVINSDQQARAIRIGLNLPREITSEHETMDVALPKDAETSALKWPCQARRRGAYPLPSAHLEIASPLRLWNIRAAQKLQTEIRVYPDLLKERKAVASVFLRQRAFGTRAQRQVGKGRDFEKLREYLPGDSFEDVHWKASAKRGHLVTKIFQIERTQEIYVAVDCSRLTNRPGAADKPGITTLDRFVTTALLLCLAAEQQGDHFGLITFSDHVHSVIRARTGKGHFALCRDALFTLEPRLVTPDFNELFSTIRLRLRKRALILILTPLDDPLLAESFSKSLELITRQHLALVAMIEPSRVEPVFKTPARDSSEVYESLAGHLIWQKLREVEKMLALRGVRFSVLANESLTQGVVSQYLEVKQRQIL